MKRFVSILVASVAALAAFASPSTRQWDEGPLKWSDFKGNPAIKSTTSYFKGFLKTVTDIEHEGKTRFNSDVRFATSAVALMDCNASYADSAYRTDQMLRYHQLQFDMLEIVRRRLQADLNSGMTGIEADNRVAYYQRIYNEQTSDLARATVNGSNDQRLQQYEYMTRKQLEEQLLPSVPEVKPGDWQAGWFVGTGCLIPTGGISDLFNYAWLFNIGLSGGYKNLILKADISYGQPDIHNFTDYKFNPFNKTTAEGNRYQSLNKYTKLLSGSVSLGYRVIDVKRFAITPHIGGGWTNYAWNSGEFKEFEENGETVWKLVTESQKESFHSFNFMAGIDFDWRFHTTVSDKSSFLSGRREQYTSSVRLTPYVICYNYGSLSPAIKGVHFGINLTYSGFIRALRIN